MHESAIFDGRGNSEERTYIRSALQAAPQTVLTGFGVNELRELYEAESLAFDVWRSGAARRMAAKGASIRVMGGDVGFADERTPELNRLVDSVDKRSFIPSLNTSASAVLFAAGGRGRTRGFVLSPAYNLHDYAMRRYGVYLESFEKIIGRPIRKDEVTRFIWSFLNIGGYMRNHAPFSNAFQAKYGVRLEAVVATIATVLASAYMMWQDSDPAYGLPAFFTHWRVAYTGPVSRALALEGLQEALPHALEWVASDVQVDPNEVPEAFTFLELSSARREEIDVLLGGPSSIFLPDGNDVLIDYASVNLLLYYLVHGIELSDQNFKAPLLEEFVRRGESILPSVPLKASDGTRKQIDAAFQAGRNLVVVECKAVGRSLGVDRGDIRAIEYRNDLVTRILGECDEKAQWLALHRSGSNFDITNFDRIVPLGVTPFVEFIPSSAAHYWLGPEIPRVLTPDELFRALDNNTLASERLYNMIALR